MLGRFPFTRPDRGYMKGDHAFESGRCSPDKDNFDIRLEN
jgi:hypothetical protein